MRGEIRIYKHLLKVVLMITMLSMLIACGTEEETTDNELTYDELIDLAVEEYETNLPMDFDSPFEDDEDIRANSNVMIWDDGQYIQLIFKPEGDGHQGGITYKVENGEFKNMMSALLEDEKEALDEKEPDYVEEQGEVIKE